MEAETAFEAFVASIPGLPISHLWRGYGSAIFIELGDLTPTTKLDGSHGHPEGRVSIGVEGSWRIEDAASIICGSWSEEDLWEASFDRLRNTRVADIQLFGTLPEVELSTDGGVRFLSFSTIDGQPQWHVVDRRTGTERWFSVREGRIHIGDGREPA